MTWDRKAKIQQDIMVLPTKYPKKVHRSKLSILRRFGVPVMTRKTKGPKLVHKWNHAYYTSKRQIKI